MAKRSGGTSAAFLAFEDNQPVSASANETSQKQESAWLRQQQESAWLRQEQGIAVEGDKPIPPPIKCFSELPLSRNVFFELRRREVTIPSPVQAQVLPCVFQSSDVVVLAPTGSGKSLCYILPIVELLQRLLNQSGLRFQQNLVPPMSLTTPCALVVVPTRELVDQVTQDIRAFFPKLTNPPIVGIYGGISVDDQVAALQLHASSPLAMVATPGRLLHLMQRHGTVLSLEHLSLFVVDEVDCVLDVLEMETQLRDILVFANSTGRQTLLFSATLPAFLPRLERSAVVHPVTIRVNEVHLPTQAASLVSYSATDTSPTAKHALSTNSNMVHDVQFMRSAEKPFRLLRVLRATKHPPVLVFCNSRSSVERVARRLRQEQFHVAPLHGGQSQGYRTQALRAFRAGYVDVLVATDLASRGLDFPGVEHVILFDVPHTLESYIHRCGRTGRHPGGNVESSCVRGKATTFLTRDCVIAKELKQWLRAASQPLPRELVRDTKGFPAPR